MHNITINLHKANCFGAAFKIIASIDNAETKQEILKLAGKEIFTQHKTGYLSKEDKIDINLLEKLAGMFSKTAK